MSQVSAYTPEQLLAMSLQDLEAVGEYLEQDVRPIADRAVSADTVTVIGLFTRALAWTRTLRILRSPEHVQAATAGARALFEICVDLALLHHERTSFPVAMMELWEDSAKLDTAEKVATFYGNNAPSPLQEARLAFRQSAEIVIARRKALWGIREHPRQRWTKRSLRDDARAADQREPKLALERYYVERFAELCWNTHGSGLVGIRRLESEELSATLTQVLDDSSRLSVHIGRLTLEYLGEFNAHADARHKTVIAASVSAFWSGPGIGWSDED